MTLRDLAWFLLGAAVATFVVSRVVRTPGETAAVATAPVPKDSLSGSTGLADELTRALQRVSSSPQDPRAWITLGDAQAAFEELDAAEHAYRTALRIRPDGLAFARLGFLLYGRGDEDEALALLVEAKRLGADVPLLDSTIRQLEARAPEIAPEVERAPDPRDGARDAGVPAAIAMEVPDAGPDAGPSSARKLPCTVAAHGGPTGAARGMIVDVVIAGERAELLVDTGATLSVITDALAGRLGLRAGAERFGVITANGKTTFGSVHAPTFALGGRVLEDVVLASCPDCMHGLADGLLGLDLQAALGIALDPSKRELRFTDCAP